MRGDRRRWACSAWVEGGVTFFGLFVSFFWGGERVVVAFYMSGCEMRHLHSQSAGHTSLLDSSVLFYIFRISCHVQPSDMYAHAQIYLRAVECRIPPTVIIIHHAASLAPLLRPSLPPHGDPPSLPPLFNERRERESPETETETRSNAGLW